MSDQDKTKQQLTKESAKARPWIAELAASEAKPPTHSGSLVPPLVLTMLAMLVGMSAYELAKQLVFPGITVWQSHIITIVFSSVAATVAAYFVLRRNQLLLQQAVEEITERKRMEAALRRHEQEFKTLVEHNPDMIARFDQEYRHIYVNPSVERELGIPPQTLLGKTHRELGMQVEQADWSEGIIRRVFESGEEMIFETTVSTNEGVKHYLTRGVPESAEDGSVTSALFIHRNITERVQAEQALKESEEKFRSLAEHSPNMIFINSKGRVVYANQRSEELLGYTRDEFYSPDFDFLTLIAPEGRDVIMSNFSRHRKGEDVEPYSYALVTRDGSRIEGILATKLIDYEGERAILGVVTDITKRKRAEEELQRRNRELALLNRAGQALASTFDLDRVLVTVLDEVRRLLDVTASSVWLIDPESNGLVCWQSTGPRSEIVRGWRLAAGDGLVGWVAQQGESLIVPDAQADERHYRDVEKQTQWEVRSALTVPLRVRESVIGVLQVVDEDVDRFKRTDLTLLEPLAASAAIAIENARLVEGLEAEVAARTAEIRVEKERSDAILRSVGDAIMVADLERKIQYVNDAFTKLTGYTTEEVVGLPTSSVGAVIEPEQSRKAVQSVVTEGKVWQGEAIGRRRDGRSYDALLTIAPIRDGEGNLVGYVSSQRDISRHKELDRARNQFITNVSHQLRTPATNLKLYAQLAQRQLRSEKAEHYVQVLEDQSDRLVHLIQDILEMTELDSSRALTDWEPVSLSTIIQDAITSYQGRAGASGLILTAIRVPSDLPAVKGDQLRLYQALGELVENALIFTPSGGQVTIEAGTAEDEGRRWVTVAVSDTGPGISPQEQERVFDRFFRGKLAESGHIPGTGLGLSIAQEIIQAHGGRVTVASKAGQGSTFTVWLPCVA